QQRAAPPATPPTGLASFPGPGGPQRGRPHLAPHPHPSQLPMQPIPGGTGLITRPQPAPVREPPDQPGHRLLIMEDPLHIRGLLPTTQNPRRDRVLMHIQTQVDQPLLVSDTVHNGRLPPHVATSRLSVDDPRTQRNGPAVPC